MENGKKSEILTHSLTKNFTSKEFDRMTKSYKHWKSTNETISPQSRTILNKYLSSLNIESKAEATITKYLWILERFLSECSIPLKHLTSDDVLRWFNKYSIGKKPKTMDLVHSCLSSFFNFCIDEEYLENMVMKKRWRPKIPHSLPRYLDPQEYARIKLTAEGLSVRNRALILFMFSSGCRRSEVSRFNINDLDFKRRTAEVIGKGGKIRQVHFSEECALVLNDYLSTRNYSDSDPLFLNRKGNRLLPKGIYEIIKKLGKKAGLHQLSTAV